MEKIDSEKEHEFEFKTTKELASKETLNEINSTLEDQMQSEKVTKSTKERLVSSV